MFKIFLGTVAFCLVAELGEATGRVGSHQQLGVYGVLNRRKDCYNMLMLYSFTKEVWLGGEQSDASLTQAYNYFQQRYVRDHSKVEDAPIYRFCVVAMRAAQAAIIDPRTFLTVFKGLKSYMFDKDDEGTFFSNNGGYYSLAESVWQQVETRFPSEQSSSEGSDCGLAIKRLLSTPFINQAGLRSDGKHPNRLISHLRKISQIVLWIYKKAQECEGADCDSCQPQWCAPLTRIMEKYLATQAIAGDSYEDGWEIFCVLVKGENYFAQLEGGEGIKGTDKKCNKVTARFNLDKENCPEALGLFTNRVNTITSGR
jgi:hypothetical protein